MHAKDARDGARECSTHAKDASAKDASAKEARDGARECSMHAREAREVAGECSRTHDSSAKDAKDGDASVKDAREGARECITTWDARDVSKQRTMQANESCTRYHQKCF
jgi:hypothetical protein